MPAAAKKLPREELFMQLAQVDSVAARRKFLSSHKQILHSEAVRRLADLVLEKIRTNTKEALNLAEAAVLIGQKLRRKEDIAPPRIVQTFEVGRHRAGHARQSQCALLAWRQSRRRGTP